ncbi:MAG: 4Fe-4S binding protein, partial [Betaproteobacteria bacterium HGW-Betaproteobacteria-21]
MVAAATLSAHAGELDKADVERRFPPPLKVGDKLQNIPAWPISSELEPDAGPVAYAFESIDLAPIPGFEGTPFNVLVAIDRKGTYLGVDVLRQHEPVFLSGLGEVPLHEFVRQYAGKSLLQQISVASIYGSARRTGDDKRVVLDGVSKATASIRILNQTVLTSALAVARAELAFAALVQGGHIGRLSLRNDEIEQLFADTDGAGQDAEGLAAPDQIGVDLYVAWLNAPTIGRALLGDTMYAYLMRSLEPGQQAYWVATAGRTALVDANF